MATERIHIVGPQRSGTTLMQALFGTCFDIDGVTTKEIHLWHRWPAGERIVMTKRPGDEVLAPLVLKLDPNLWFVFMLRDPRDVVVSEHGREPGKYWSNLRVWRQAIGVLERMKGHPRFIVVRYEDLVTDPDSVQRALAARMAFLRPVIPFSQYHDHTSQAVAQSGQFNRAMRGIRPVTSESVGAWRAHLPRVKAQLATHGDVADALITLGYEKDESWRAMLDAVAPDTQISVVPDRLSAWRRLQRGADLWVHLAQYIYGRYVHPRGLFRVKSQDLPASGTARGP